MYVEVPILKRCCFCLPLRRGLLAWGYLHAGVCLCLGLVAVEGAVSWASEPRAHDLITTYLVAAELISVIMNLSISVVLIAAAHSVSYRAGAAALGVDTLLMATDVEMWYNLTHLTNYFVVTSICASALTVLGVKAYAVILTRSEYLKVAELSTLATVETGPNRARAQGPAEGTITILSE